MQLAITVASRTLGQTVGEIVGGFLGVSENRARSITRLRSKARAIKIRREKMFGLLGRTCYRLTDQGKNFLSARRVLDIMERIETCQTELQRIAQRATA